MGLCCSRGLRVALCCVSNEFKLSLQAGFSLVCHHGLPVLVISTVTHHLPLLSIVVKYRKGDEDTLIEKISKLSMHSIIKKSNRVSSHLKHLTGISPQVQHYNLGLIASFLEIHMYRMNLLNPGKHVVPFTI